MKKNYKVIIEFFFFFFDGVIIEY